MNPIDHIHSIWDAIYVVRIFKYGMLHQDDRSSRCPFHYPQSSAGDADLCSSPNASLTIFLPRI
jgi:hypothetical protein